MLYPDGVIHLQQDHSSIHDSRVVQEWLSRQADVELLDWPQRAPVEWGEKDNAVNLVCPPSQK